MPSNARILAFSDYDGDGYETGVPQNYSNLCDFHPRSLKAQNLQSGVCHSFTGVPRESNLGLLSDGPGTASSSMLQTGQTPHDYMTRVSPPIHSVPILQQTDASRREQSLSQATVIINRDLHNQKRDHSQLQVYTAREDEKRQQAEREYYEVLDSEGYLRRRSMTRAVSQEDCLLGRGVNPRTGLVTPSGATDTHDTGPAAALPTHTLSASTKWRQHGNQWISLDVGEPTPGTHNTDVPQLAVSKTRSPQTPQRLRQIRTDTERQTSRELQKAAALNRVSNKESQQLQAAPKSNPSMPGSYPHTPENQSAQTLIRRKPLAAYDDFTSQQIHPMVKGPKQLPPGYSERSVSAPVLSKPLSDPAGSNKVTYEGIGSSASLSESRDVESGSQATKAFLGPQQLTPADHDRTLLPSRSAQGLDLDKELPCLPMNSGQFPQARSTSSPLTSASPGQDPKAVRKLQQALQNPPIFQQHSTQDMHGFMPPMLDNPLVGHQQGRTMKSRMPCGVSAVPTYDNPPMMLNPRPTPQRVGGSRPMPPPVPPLMLPYHARPRKNLGPYARDHSNTMCMSTGIFTQSYDPRAIPKIPNSLSSMNHCPQGVRSTAARKQQNLGFSGRMAPDGTTNQRSAMLQPCGNLAGLARPPMPSRAVGVHDVPQMKEAMNSHGMIHMGPHTQLNTTGMVQKPHKSRDVNLQPDQFGLLLGNKTLKGVSGENVNLETESPKEAFHGELLRKCSRCQNGLTARAPGLLDGLVEPERHRKLSTTSAKAPEVAGTATITTKPPPCGTSTDSIKSSSVASSDVSSATIVNVQEDLRDHSICCPSCCKMGCHEGCLGHEISSTKAKQDLLKSRRRADSSDTLVSSTNVSTTSSANDLSPSKLSFIRFAFKTPFRHKRSIDTLSSTGDTAQSKDTLSPSTPLTTSTHDDTALFSGTDGASGFFGAVAAAKKAIGFDTYDASQENGLNQFIVPKKRPKARKVADSFMSKYQVETPNSTRASSPTLAGVESAKWVTTANESRKLSGSRPCSVGGQGNMLGQRRTVSAASNTSIEVRLPAMDNISLKSVFEMLVLVPSEAIRMCIHNNPQILNFGWSMLDHAYAWTLVIATTSQIILTAIYIYSKTGKLKLRNANGSNIGAVDFLGDCLRSALYILVLSSLAVILIRLLKMFLWPLQILCAIGRYMVLGSRKIRIL